MKKSLFVLMLAILAASCTYKSTVVSQRTPDNLAYLNNEIINSTITAATLVLSDIDGNKLDYILSASFDTLITSDAYKERFSASAAEMSITLVADSTWAVTSTGTGSLSFIADIYMTGRKESDKSPLFSTDYNGYYDEGNGFSAEFVSPLLKYYWTYVPTYYEGFGYYNILTLMCEGDTYLTTYLNMVKLDSFKATYDASGIKY
ncbi:MAG: hypothetical protein IKX45_02250 [Bacteroidales bacterium]|nr:hypothetical protein [Bacteroidales bacterium]